MTNTILDIENTAVNSIKSLSLKTLCESYELTNRTTDDTEDSYSVATVRGWLMDELERRNPEKFLEWLETEDIELMDSPSKFFL